MKQHRLSMRWVLTVALLLAASTAAAGEARYIFLFIGDGMSLAQRTAAEYYLAGAPAQDEKLEVQKLAMNALPVAGLTSTTAWNAHVTDSAASATAMATGHKTRPGMVSVDPVTRKPLRTLADILLERGWRVGLVSSSFIDDATAGAFYAHEPKRGNHYEIAMAAAESGLTYLGGAGPRGGRMADDDDRPSPIDVAEKNGFRLVHKRDEFLKLTGDAGRVWAFPAGRNRYPLGMSFDMDMPEGSISLVDYTRKGIELLDNPDGFFFMVEGGLTDWAGHGNCLASSIREVLVLDECVKLALEFQRKHPDETLIVITGDHDTGGLAMGSALSDHSGLRASVDGQTVSMATLMSQIREWRDAKTPFEEALPRIREMFSWDEPPGEDVLAELRAAYAASVQGAEAGERSGVTRRLYGKLDPLQAFLLWKVAGDSGVTWTTTGHSSLPVLTTAIGAGAERFGGWHDNTDIFRFLLESAAGGEKPSE